MDTAHFLSQCANHTTGVVHNTSLMLRSCRCRWRFSATTAGSYTFNTCGSSYDSYVHVYRRTGSNTRTSLVASCDDCGKRISLVLPSFATRSSRQTSWESRSLRSPHGADGNALCGKLPCVSLTAIEPSFLQHDFLRCADVALGPAVQSTVSAQTEAPTAFECSARLRPGEPFREPSAAAKSGRATLLAPEALSGMQPRRSTGPSRPPRPSL